MNSGKGEVPWYQRAFREDYLARYAHRDEREARQAVALFLRFLPRDRPSTVFDLCCGAGRHLQVLRAGGAAAMGGDLSAPLLRHAAREGLPVVRLNMRILPLRDACLDGLSNFFTAFGYFESDRENFMVLEEVARVLRPGGVFLLDFLNATLVRSLIGSGGEEEMVTDSAGERWKIRRRITAGGRVEKEHVRVDGGKEEAPHFVESVRLFEREDLCAALEGAGFEVIRTMGNYEGEPFLLEGSPRLILVSRRRPLH